jgi:hypothetical protein
MGYNNGRLKILRLIQEILLMNVNTNDVIVSEKPMRITRIVSVILNGVVLSKLAMQNGNDVNAMADTLMLNLSDKMQRNILSSEMTLVEHSLKMEIGRRINLPQAV